MSLLAIRNQEILSEIDEHSITALEGPAHIGRDIHAHGVTSNQVEVGVTTNLKAHPCRPHSLTSTLYKINGENRPFANSCSSLHSPGYS